jgi:hypothetical protein
VAAVNLTPNQEISPPTSSGSEGTGGATSQVGQLTVKPPGGSSKSKSAVSSKKAKAVKVVKKANAAKTKASL